MIKPPEMISEIPETPKSWRNKPNSKNKWNMIDMWVVGFQKWNHFETHGFLRSNHFKNAIDIYAIAIEALAASLAARLASSSLASRHVRRQNDHLTVTLVDSQDLKLGDVSCFYPIRLKTPEKVRTEHEYLRNDQDEGRNKNSCLCPEMLLQRFNPWICPIPRLLDFDVAFFGLWDHITEWSDNPPCIVGRSENSEAKVLWLCLRAL